jgi:preprotein translocase subunit SecE
VSDEREGAAGLENGADDTTPGGQTAVVTRPLRPAGKRSRRVEVDSEAVEAEAIERVGETKGGLTKAVTATKPKVAQKEARPSRNPLMFVINYLRQVVTEMRKVIWPNRKQMVNYTAVVLVFLAFMVALIGLVDLGLAKLVMLVFG